MRSASAPKAPRRAAATTGRAMLAALVLGLAAGGANAQTAGAQPPVQSPAQPSATESCGIDRAALENRLQELEQSYLILSDMGCADEDPTLPAHVLMCESMWADGALWKMAQLDDAAWVYAYENATGTETDHDDPPRDAGFIATRDACTDAACLCSAYIDHTNGSLGGLSPYAQ